MTGPDVAALLRAERLPLDQFVVFAGAALALRGIRQTEDVDLIVSKPLFRALRKSGWTYAWFRKGWRFYRVARKGRFEAFPHFTRGAFRQRFADVCGNADIIEGVPVMSVPDLIANKRALGREKDFKDIGLLTGRAASR